MEISNYRKLLLSTVTILLLSACSSGGTTPDTHNKEIAIDKIEAYATNGQDAPSAEDYTAAGVTGVNADNLEKVNALIVSKTATEVDTTTEIQTLVNSTVPVIITHHGVQYGVVVSPITGRTWLDRNAGASQVCNTPYDRVCFGDYYQWGRNTDGHEKYNSKTTLKKGETLTDSGDKFVIKNGDWTTDSHRNKNWNATDGKSVCPVGYRVPSIEEFQADTSDITDKVTQGGNFLKLSYSGYRSHYRGEIQDKGKTLNFWLNQSSDDTNAFSIYSSGGAIRIYEWDYRSEGMSVRCIKAQ